MLDIKFYPHLFDEVVAYVHAADDVRTLSALRAAGRAAQRSVDKQLASHIVVAGSRPGSRYYQTWRDKWLTCVRTVDVFPYDGEGTGSGVCSAFLRNCRPRHLRVYGQRALTIAPSVRALIQVLSYAEPMEFAPVLLPKAHNVLCIDAHVAAALTFFDLEPCGSANLTINLLPFFAEDTELGPRDRAVVFSTLNNVVRWAEDQLELHPGLTLAFVGPERRRRGFAFQCTWQAMQDRLVTWASEIVFDMHVDFAERIAFLSHARFRAMHGDELYRLVVDT